MNWIAGIIAGIMSLFGGGHLFGTTILYPIGGGTGSSTLSGILVGNGTGIVKTLTIGTNLTLTGTTLNASGGGSDPFYHPTATQSATTTQVSFYGNASSTQLTATSSVWFTNLASRILSVDANGQVIGTSTPTAANFYATSTTASQFPYASTTAFSFTATSTGTKGIDISAGCFAFNSVCLQTFIQNATAYKQAVNYATAAVLTGTPTYSNGSAGVGATLTEVGLGALSVDGQAVSAGQRLLIKDQVDQTTNGIYVVTTPGSGIASYVLTRTTDYDETTDVYAGTTVPVLAGGTANSDTQWTETTTGTIVMGTSNIVFEETAFGTSGPTSVSNSDGTLTISPTTGAVIASVALTHSNIWTGAQLFSYTGTSTFSSGIESGTKIAAPYFNATSSTATSTFLGGVSFPALKLGSTVLSSIGSPLTTTNGVLGCTSCNTSNATVSSIAGGTGLNGGTITTSGTLSLISYIATSSAETNGQIPYWTTSSAFPAKFGSVATTAVACSGFITCTGFNALGAASTITTTGTLGLTSGGTAASLSGANQILFMNSGNTAVSTNSNLQFINNNLLTIGTTTPFWALTVASSTGPQLALIDHSASSSIWTMRSATNILYFATSTVTATSTVSAFYLDANGIAYHNAGLLSMGSTTIRGNVFTMGGLVGLSSSTPSALWGISIGTTTVVQNAQIAVTYASTTNAAASFTVNWDQGNSQRIIASTTLSIILNATSSAPRDGGKYLLKICQDGTGSRTITWLTPGQLIWANGTTTLTTAANSATLIGMIYDAHARGAVGAYDIVASSTISDGRSCI